MWILGARVIRHGQLSRKIRYSVASVVDYFQHDQCFGVIIECDLNRSGLFELGALRKIGTQHCLKDQRSEGK